MSPSPVKEAEAVPSEIEVTSPVVWGAFIYDESGFVVSDHEDLLWGRAQAMAKALTEFEARR